MSTSPELITGEAVPLELRLARLPSRMLALSIDIVIQLTALFAVLTLFGATASALDPALGAALGLVLVIAIIVGYPVVLETFTRGRTVGKLALGLRVVRDDGGPVAFRHSLVRGLAEFFVDIWLTLGVGALIASLASSKGKRVGDLLAGTVVVRERVPVQGAPMAWMPPQLAWWAQNLDLSRLPDDLALQARQFLARVNQLAPDVRMSLGARLATSVAQYISPSSPPDTPAEAYLAAVLAERRRRELVRYAQPHQQQAPMYQPAYPPPTTYVAPPPEPSTAQPAQPPQTGFTAPS